MQHYCFNIQSGNNMSLKEDISVDPAGLLLKQRICLHFRKRNYTRILRVLSVGKKLEISLIVF